MSSVGVASSVGSPHPSRWQVAVEWGKEAWADWRQLVSLKNNFTLKTCCVLLMLKCAFVALTGRGVVSIIQAIGGVIFSIEGFWGAVKFDAATIKRFLIFLVCYFLVSTAIAIINLETLSDYCSTAVDVDDRQWCLDTARLYSFLLLGTTLGFVPIVFGVGVVFYLAIQSNEISGQTRRRKDGKVDGGYDLAPTTIDIVERMGFSSD